MLFTTTITMPTFTKTEMQDFEKYPILPPDQFISSAEKMPFIIPKVDNAIWEMIGEYKEILEKREWDEKMPDIYEEYTNELNSDGTHGIINWETISKDKEKFTHRLLDALNANFVRGWKGSLGSEAKHMLRLACNNGVFPKKCMKMEAISFYNFFMKYKDPSAEKIDYFDTQLCPYLFEKFIKDGQRFGIGVKFHINAFVSYENWSDEDCKKYHCERFKRLHDFQKSSGLFLFYEE